MTMKPLRRAQIVKRITPSIVARAFGNLAKENPYYIREQGGRDSIRGCMLRVHRRDVFFGTRYGASEWHKILRAHPEMTTQEVDEARILVRQRVRELEDEVGQPLLKGRRMKISELKEHYLTELIATRGENRSPRTIESYKEIWRVHLLPAIGDLRLCEITPERVIQLKTEIPKNILARRVAKGGGRTTANRALQQADAAFNFAFRMGWIQMNPFSTRVVARYYTEPDQYFLDGRAHALLGRALREAEALLDQPRAPLPYRSIAGIRLLLLTGARPNEIVSTVLRPEDASGPNIPYLILHDGPPRIQIPRAKGDRGNQKRPPGRVIWLPPQAVEIIQRVPRPADAIHMLPGDLPGQHVQRLNKSWNYLLREAGLEKVPLKTMRPSFRTMAPEVGVAPEHIQQLMGHAGLRITDTTYLKRNAPALCAAAARMATFITELLEADPN